MTTENKIDQVLVKYFATESVIYYVGCNKFVAGYQMVHNIHP